MPEGFRLVQCFDADLDANLTDGRPEGILTVELTAPRAVYRGRRSTRNQRPALRTRVS